MSSFIEPLRSRIAFTLLSVSLQCAVYRLISVSVYVYSGAARFIIGHVTGGYVFALFDSLDQSTNYFLNPPLRYLSDHIDPLDDLVHTRDLRDVASLLI